MAEKPLNIYDKEGFNMPIYQDNATEKDFFSDQELRRFWNMAMRSWFWVMLILGIGIFSGWTFMRYTKPVYQSVSILKLESKNDAMVLGLENLQSNQSSNNLRNLSGEIEFIKSRLVFEKTLERLPIAFCFYEEGKILNEEKYQNSPINIQYQIINPKRFDSRFDIRFISEDEYRLSYIIGGQKLEVVSSFGVPVINSEFVFTIDKSSVFSSESLNKDYFFYIKSKETLIAYLENNLNIEILNPDANTLKVTFKDYNTQKARDIVSVIDSVYLEETIAQKTKAQEQTLQFLEENLEITEARLTSAEQRLESFMRENKTLDVKDDVSRIITKIEDLDKQKISLRLRVAYLDDLQELILSDKDIKAFTPSMSDVGDVQLIRLVEELNNFQQERTLMLTRSKEQSYAVKAINLSIENLKSAILNAVSQNRKLAFQQLSGLEQQIREFEKSFLTLPGKETEFARIKRFYDLYEKYYMLLMEKKAEFGIAKAGMVPNFVILYPADLANTPVFPQKIYVYLVCIGLALLCSFFLVVVRFLFDNTITSQIELENSVAATILGGVPAYKKGQLDVSRLVVNRNPKAAISESFRSIRTNLDFVSPSEQCKVISITSTVSGEGKTFVALNLGGIIALSEKRVLIIDLDMRKPKIHLGLDVNNDRGISTVLIGRDEVHSCINKTDIKNLDFIAAGPTPPNPSELILRSEFSTTLDELKKVYDVIILDTPPVGLVTDAVLLMKKADIQVYVVRANYSKKSSKNTINKLVKNTGFSNLCLILNAVNSFSNVGYGYGNSYGYGYYDEDHQNEGIVERLKKLIKF
jgi:tyrosine-protein kinase Etk/Wzc